MEVSMGGMNEAVGGFGSSNHSAKIAFCFRRGLLVHSVRMVPLVAPLFWREAALVFSTGLVFVKAMVLRAVGPLPLRVRVYDLSSMVDGEERASMAGAQSVAEIELSNIGSCPVGIIIPNDAHFLFKKSYTNEAASSVPLTQCTPGVFLNHVICRLA